ncbi:MAG: M48 family metalloprotease [Planctomycetes bacterium]|nr:M48 family metalloprotease [Planctomycetota bacterium]
MVWWAGGKVQIVIPTALLDQMDAHEWQWVLAHEMAHVRR